MADAIQWSLPLGNGAVTLHYNEIVDSWSNGYRHANTFDYEIMIVINPLAISSFIITKQAYLNIGSNTINIDSQSPNGTSVPLCTLNVSNSNGYTGVNAGIVAFLLK